LLESPENIRPLRGRAWRAVEPQHRISTRKLVDSDEEQQILEDLLERAKPPVRTGEPFDGLHYLLATPFRYPPLNHGSRFGTRAEPSLWYGSRELRTCFAETAYYRLLFLEGSAAGIEPLETEVTAFQVSYRTAKGVDFSTGALAGHRRAISSPTSYAAPQEAGRLLRRAGVQVLRFFSARDREDGLNLAFASPTVFGGKRPDALESWFLRVERSGVTLVSADLLTERRFHFPREQFLVGDSLPEPAF
jgi:hypothetical protein